MIAFMFVWVCYCPVLIVSYYQTTSMHHFITHANRWNNIFSRSSNVNVRVKYEFILSESKQKEDEASVILDGDASSTIQLLSSSITHEVSLESATESTVITGESWKASEYEINRRRNFAIISHPDAGKTTLTEKLLLFGGAIQDAGAVKARADQRKATSDWMEIEKQRGISVTSTVLSFEYSPGGSSHGVASSSRHANKYQLNLLDTPGHQDFSEDTYRTLAAADNCVMLIDAAKGIEDRTRKLFQVCKMRKLPVFTFANKLDRPSLSPFDVIDQVDDVMIYPIIIFNHTDTDHQQHEL